ncbi:MAG: terminase small subunit protein [Phenylobacterium sp.]|uniref:terminase small subunit-like protein n=1 Tax=Phenylobacterium sp. TaxID=1871053 RepID=UPI001209976F|nr:hypothetical protein [Phenylobacterium sp.]TAL32085.1 MAG: terminase small subunit protein [Phenylobacterium sp.]
MTKMGRPTKRTPEIEREILSRLAEGESLREICRDEHMPMRSNVSLWVREDRDFQDQVARAREDGTWHLIDEAREIADTPKEAIKTQTKETEDGIETTTVIMDATDRDKLRIEQRWREAEALAPKVYGKRQTLTHEGSIDVNLTDDSDALMAEIVELLMSGRVKLPNGLQVIELDDEEEPAEDDYSDIA